MLKIDSVKLSPRESEGELRSRAAAVLHIPVEQILSLSVLRRSIDARDGVALVYSLAAEVGNEERVLRRCRRAQVSLYSPVRYALPPAVSGTAARPVVVGAGPAGLFAALVLASCGARPILLERGQCVERRRQDVERFWAGGALDGESNVQFGEGGAGTFSDGKLNTGTKDIRHDFILRTFTSLGAGEDILVDAKPHIGTDRLYTVMRNLRSRLLGLGCEIRFGHRLAGLEQSDGRVSAVLVDSPEGQYRLETHHVLLALGHSARDSFAMLHRAGLAMERKPFAVGVRIEHAQSDMDAAQYRSFAGHPSLPPTSYKLAVHTSEGRGVFSFCVCPGGQVVAAASEHGHLVTNGMSESRRSGENINGGLLVSVTPEDFGGTDVLAGVAFQRRLEAAAYALGGGGFSAPAQRVEDFLLHRPSVGPGRIVPTYRPAVRWCDLHGCLPDFICRALTEALPMLDGKIRGFASPDAVMTAVETRSSSPVRILRDETLQANLRGVYPCGEGAGYAGGIMSAAADGMRCAEFILKEL